MIRFKNIYKTFHKAKTYREMFLHPLRPREKIVALRGISGHIEKGHLYSLLGPNGAGKTTLLKILCTLILPNQGDAWIDKHSVLTKGHHIRKTIGLVQSDERSFYWRLTGRQNLEFYGTLQCIEAKVLKRRINENLELTGLSKAADRQFQTYSTGMRQKLAIARGLLHNPKIIILDEPTRSLDPLIALQLRDFIKNELVSNLGKTVTLATHNLPEAESLSDKVGIINKGRMVAEGSVKELAQRLGNRLEIRLYLKKDLSQSDQERLPSTSEYDREKLLIRLFLSKEEEIVSMLKQILPWLPECKIEQKKLNLEEIFARLLKGKQC